MHGAPALPDGFDALPYVNPDAPKGGRLTEGVLGTFDSLNPLIVQGLAVQPIRGYVIESLMARSYDEPFTLYGLLAKTVETDAARSYVTFTLDPAAHFSDGSPVTAADVVFSSNVLEHVSDPMGLIEEMIRVTRPGGLVYLSYCNWYSPWGGHEMSPWHYLGPRYAERRYIRRYQRKPKHEVGVNLFQVHVGPILRALRARPDIQIVEARPRYYPRWCRLLVKLPGLREAATWNLMLIMRRVG